MRLDLPLLAGAEPTLGHCMWSATAGPPPPEATLGAEERCDVLIIGGGFNGVTAGLKLAQAGARAILIEAREIGAGSTGRNAGMVNPGQFLGPEEIARHLGPDHGRRFVTELGAAPAMVRALIAEHAIACFLDDRPIIRAAHSSGAARVLHAQTEAWQRLGADVVMVEGHDLEALTGSRRYGAALLDRRGFTIQPLAYIRGLASAATRFGLRIATGRTVTGLTAKNGTWLAQAGDCTIQADKVIVSTNAYSGDLLPELREEIMPLGAFGFATDPLPAAWRARIFPQGHSLYDTHKVPLFFRYDPEGRLMVGCIGFLPKGLDSTGWADRALRFVFPQAPRFPWRFRWSGRLGQTPDRLPHFVEPRPGLLATLGCNGRGIAPNTYFGAMLARLALGETLQTPLPRTAPHAYPNRALAREGYDAAIRLYRNTLLFT
ncbi:NAD(P)/FAD-dependent oxidoreductase [Ancylobacter pratisalsi]|uniref:FAD-binding oxidoreductase n=1 Tax=Ancylobacter pratisalsi TaxID=1745854 RepID=A0A6P1YPG4_9HYPH|nr:FAD-binding oxidoreductase [Ancylobacter pratisalsi]QIB34596.1 FAD-binding oxidoreductase [Ancylobacter pratisalsi]